MLIEPAATPYDLRFMLFGTPVRVNPLFWLVTAILGWPLVDFGLFYLGLWVALAFLSILLHEFGHVWMGRLFGADPAIVLYGFGGLALDAGGQRARWQRILVSLAGPLIQLVVLYLPIRLWLHSASREQLKEIRPELLIALSILLEINLYWPLLNLLPIWPLDGGKVCQELCSAVSPGRGMRWALMISTVVAGLFAINALVGMNRGEGFIPWLPTGGFYTVILFGMLALESWQAMRLTQPWHYEPPDDSAPWENRRGNKWEV